MTGFYLLEGVTIYVQFKYANTAASPTLNIESTGAFPITEYGSSSTSAGISWLSNSVIAFTYVKDENQNGYWVRQPFKVIQEPLASPTTNTTAVNAFIDTISQDANGKITATKKNIPLIDVTIPQSSNAQTSVLNTTTRTAVLSYASTSNYGLVKVNNTGTSSNIVPVYINSSGELVACSQYAGGTKVTLNGTGRGTQDISIYAPTTEGNVGQLLISKGQDNAPIWTSSGIVSSITANNVTTNYWKFNNKVGIGTDTAQTAYTLYVGGDSATSGNVTFTKNDGNTIEWFTGQSTDSIRPKLTVNKENPTSHPEAFTFSIGTSTTNTDLFTIEKDGDIVVLKDVITGGDIYATSGSGHFKNVVIGGDDNSDRNIISTISGKDLLISPAGELIFYQTFNGSESARISLNNNIFIPLNNNTMSLGTSSYRWKDIYAEDLIVIGNDSSAPTGSNRTLRIYNSSANFTNIKSQANGDHTFFLPNYNGDMYAVHTSSNSVVGGNLQAVYVAANGRITASTGSAGSQYQPVYLNSGILTAAYPVQYVEWSFAANDIRIDLESSSFTTDVYVIELVVTNGESNLTGPITWNTTTTGHLQLETTAVSGTVNGYVILSYGQALSNLTVTHTQSAT